MLAVAILMAFARRYPRHWWLPVMPVFLAVATVFLLVSPYLLALGVNPPAKPALRADIQRLERVEHVEGTPVDVEKVSDTTTQANAFATGLGRTTRVVLYDTLLDKRFSRGEVRFVVAHEFGHVAHKHLWKGLGWTVLFASPLAFLLAQVTWRRGGLGDPGVLPYGLLVLVLANSLHAGDESRLSAFRVRGGLVGAQGDPRPRLGARPLPGVLEDEPAAAESADLGLPLLRHASDGDAADRDDRSVEAGRGLRLLRHRSPVSPGVSGWPI